MNFSYVTSSTLSRRPLSSFSYKMFSKTETNSASSSWAYRPDLGAHCTSQAYLCARKLASERAAASSWLYCYSLAASHLAPPCYKRLDLPNSCSTALVLIVLQQVVRVKTRLFVRLPIESKFRLSCLATSFRRVLQSIFTRVVPCWLSETSTSDSTVQLFLAQNQPHCYFRCVLSNKRSRSQGISAARSPTEWASNSFLACFQATCFVTSVAACCGCSVVGSYPQFYNSYTRPCQVFMCCSSLYT